MSVADAESELLMSLQPLKYSYLLLTWNIDVTDERLLIQRPDVSRVLLELCEQLELVLEHFPLHESSTHPLEVVQSRFHFVFRFSRRLRDFLKEKGGFLV